MGDCDSFPISPPGIDCKDNPLVLATWYAETLQDLADHIIACLDDVIIPDVEICAEAPDLNGCPLSVEKLDFHGVTWGTDGDVAVLPYPPNLLVYRFKAGVATTADRAGANHWASAAVTFDEPFPTALLWVGVTPYECGDGDPLGCGDDTYLECSAPYVKDLATTGFTAWILGATDECDAKITFYWFAVGQ